MVLDRLKQLFTGKQLTAYEREVLAREYDRVGQKLETKQRQLGGVQCVGCAKKEDPRANRLIAQIKALKKRQSEIEKELGGVPETPETRASRRSKRASA